MKLSPTEAVVVAAQRTPIGRAFKGSLVGHRGDDLAAHAIKATLAQVPQVDPSSIEDLILGCGQPAGEQGYNLARPVTLLAGLSEAAGTTVNRYCASSLQALRMGFHAIRAGEGEAFMIGGVEAVSRFVKGKADGMDDTKNPRFFDPDEVLPEVYLPMGETAERVADAFDVTRLEMDAYAAESQRRAVAAVEAGLFDREIAAVRQPDGSFFARDECPRAGTTAEKLSALKPVFRPDGRVTAGNACPLNDGAVAALLLSAERAAQLGVLPRARIVATAVSALDPQIMGVGPIEASRRVLKRAHMSIADIDRVELNEAFAAQVIPSMRALAIDPAKLNVRGGAIALGHPFGMTGLRLVTTLLHSLEDDDQEIGLATLCVGGGQGMALILQRL
jgi:acetyl-CoA C-acetyltransferase